MIVHILADIVAQVVGDVVTRVGAELLGAVLPKRRTAPGRPWPKQVIVGAGAMANRAALYRKWAEAHGLGPTELRGAELAGNLRGRATEMVTGLYDTPLPKSPEILVRVALEGIIGSTLLERNAEQPENPTLRALAAVLEVDGIRDIGVTSRFVRLRFDAFVETAAFEDALDAFEGVLRALAPADTSPYR